MIPDHLANYLAIALIPLLFIVPMVTLRKNKYAFHVITFSMVFKVVLVLINTYIYHIFPYDNDWLGLNEWARYWAYNNNSIFENLLETRGRTFYAWMISIYYRVVGEALLFIFLVNVIFTTLVAIYAYKTTLILANSRMANFVITIVAFFPTYLVYSTGPSREPTVTLGFVIGLYYFVKWVDDRSLISLLCAFLGFLLALSIHTAFAVVLLLVLIIAFISSGREMLMKKTRSLPLFLFTSVWAITIISLVLVAGWGLGKVGGSLLNVTNVEILEDIATTRDGDARTGYMPRHQVFIGSIGDFVEQTPIRLLYFIFKPYPWEISTINDMVGALIYLVYMIFFVSLFKARKIILHDRRLVYTTGIILVLTLMFALGTSNWGTAARHKSKYLTAVVIISSLILTRRPDRYSNKNDRILIN